MYEYENGALTKSDMMMISDGKGHTRTHTQISFPVTGFKHTTFNKLAKRGS
jgi:hypothetical protein